MGAAPCATRSNPSCKPDSGHAGAILEEADLKGAYLGGACLKDADLSGADLDGADLFGADTTGIEWDNGEG